MDYIAILKRAFHITFKYRALWLFGILLAIFSGDRRAPNVWSGNGAESNSAIGKFPVAGNPFSGMDVPLLLAIIFAVLVIVLLLMILAIIVRSVSRAALIGMVWQVEDTAAVTVKDGWHTGWSRRAWRIFLINVIVGVPLVLVALITLALAASPLTLLLIDNSFAPLAILLTVLFVVLWIFLLIPISIIVSPFLELSWRFAALEETGAIESLRRTVTLIRQRWKDVAIATAVMIGVGFAVAIVMFAAIILLILLGVMIGAVPALAAYLLTQEPMAALLAGVPVFLVMVILPAIFISGLTMVYQSTAWTLIFREIQSGAKTPETPDKLPETSASADQPLETISGTVIMDGDDKSPAPENAD